MLSFRGELQKGNALHKQMADTFGLYSDERQLLNELQAMEQGVAVNSDQQKLTGVKRSGEVVHVSKQKSGRYDNQFDKPLNVECNRRKGESLYKVNSRYSSYNKDRQWKWTCRRSSSVPLTNCRWTSEINDWQETVRYMCPRNKIMAGLKSRHYNSKEDRRWRVMCCEAKGYHTEGCLMTRKLNQYKQVFSYQASGGRGSTGVLVGLESDFKRQYNDRRWQFLECSFVKDDKDNKHNDNECDCDKDDRSKSKSKSNRRKTCNCDKDDDRSRDRSKSKEESSDRSRQKKSRNQPCDKSGRGRGRRRGGDNIM